MPDVTVLPIAIPADAADATPAASDKVFKLDPPDFINFVLSIPEPATPPYNKLALKVNLHYLLLLLYHHTICQLAAILRQS